MTDEQGPTDPIPGSRGVEGGAEPPSPEPGIERREGLRDHIRRRVGPWARAGFAAAAVGLLLLGGTGFDYQPVRLESEPEAALDAARALDDPETKRLRSDRRQLARELDRLVPRGPYIVIDQTHNRIRLLRGRDTLLEAPCSAGSGVILKEREGSRVWVFDTPRGVFSVISKTRNPVWKKPDWAFVEEGQPIPPNPADRLEYGALGEYALYFGNGYLIHGTLYERLIGRAVSHGCIRVGRESLREIYRATPLGAPIFIY